MEPEPTAGMEGRTIGGFRLLREVARGGMGVVYEAVHERIGYRAAVKLLPAELAAEPKYDDYLARFYDEARAVNIIAHPGVVKIFDFGRLEDGAAYIMMELLDGEPLSARLDRAADRGRPLPLPEAVGFTRQIDLSKQLRRRHPGKTPEILSANSA